MTSTSIYTPITPTYLYIKQHSITKKKYYGKTTKDPYEYNGSGKHWGDHIKVHDREHIVTLWVSDLYFDTSIVEVALKFSSDNDIVNSDEWANMEPENGLNGWVPGRKRSEETKAKMRRSEEQKAARSVRQTGKKHKPHKNKGVSQPQPQITCPHCGKTGGANGMKRWHFDKCKLASKS